MNSALAITFLADMLSQGSLPVVVNLVLCVVQGPDAVEL